MSAAETASFEVVAKEHRSGANEKTPLEDYGQEHCYVRQRNVSARVDLACQVIALTCSDRCTLKRFGNISLD
jgi:hypothetical protein